MRRSTGLLLGLVLLVLCFEGLLRLDYLTTLASEGMSRPPAAPQEPITDALIREWVGASLSVSQIPSTTPSNSVVLPSSSPSASRSSPSSHTLAVTLSVAMASNGIEFFKPGDARVDNLRYLFFLSMGHQGTTTLSRICNSTARLCNFETRWGSPEVQPRTMCLHSRENGLDITQWSRDIMSRVYVPNLRDQMAASKRDSVMEPGHILVCGRMYAALCELLGDEIGIVRWNRHPLQTAWSFCGTDSGSANGAEILTKTISWILIMDEASYLRIPQQEYNSFNCFQAALWAQDELQQQYLDAARNSCRGRIVTEKRWADRADYSSAIQDVARILPDWLDPSREQVDNEHVSHSEYQQRLSELRGYHDDYIEIMRKYYPDLPDQLDDY